jgi:ABC-type sugar transport system substrate-binding protein
MADPQVLYRQLLDTLPELGRIIAHDFEHFKTCRRDNLVGYAQTLQKLAEILLTLPYGNETEEAIKVIRDFIASRQEPPGQWKSSDWLAYMLGQAVEKAKKRQKRRKLAKDELPF